MLVQRSLRAFRIIPDASSLRYTFRKSSQYPQGLRALSTRPAFLALRSTSIQKRQLTMAAAPANGAPHDQTMDELLSTLQRFGIQDVPPFPNAYPALNPVDIYRAHITDLLAPITGADPKVIYSAIQWTQTLDKGDCVLPVPALRLKGKKPDDIAKNIVDNVCSQHLSRHEVEANTQPYSSQNLLSSKSPATQAHSSNSSSSQNPSPTSSFPPSSAPAPTTASTQTSASTIPQNQNKTRTIEN